MQDAKNRMRDAEWRVFCAVDLTEPARVHLLEHIQRLRSLLPQVQASWSRETNIHLTLKFVGEISRELVPAFSDAVSCAVTNLAPFSVVLEGAGVFPKRRDPRVLWIGISDPEGKLAELHSRLEGESAKAGFSREARPFHPHLTLARLRSQRFASGVVQAHQQSVFEPQAFTVAELLVIRSELTNAGSRYTVLSRHPLQK
ncbi:MAG: RNA 2',3'-cyclic phosphodiesterase [Pyrinomonadaceae bacterium]